MCCIFIPVEMNFLRLTKFAIFQIRGAIGVFKAVSISRDSMLKKPAFLVPANTLIV